MAATIGVRFDPVSGDLLSNKLPSDLDSTSSGNRVQQPVSIRSEYLSGQVAEGQAIIDALDRRLPALQALTASIEEHITSSTAAPSSDLRRDPMVIPEDEHLADPTCKCHVY